MNTKDFIDYCLQKNGAYLDYPFGEDVTIIKVENRIFAQFFDLKNKPYATLNSDAVSSDFYRQQYPNVIRGYHCPPVQQPYFNTFPIDGTVSDEFIISMINNSYKYVVGKLPKYKQIKLLNKD